MPDGAPISELPTHAAVCAQASGPAVGPCGKSSARLCPTAYRTPPRAHSWCRLCQTEWLRTENENHHITATRYIWGSEECRTGRSGLTLRRRASAAGPGRAGPRAWRPRGPRGPSGPPPDGDRINQKEDLTRSDCVAWMGSLLLLLWEPSRGASGELAGWDATPAPFSAPSAVAKMIEPAFEYLLQGNIIYLISL